MHTDTIKLAVLSSMQELNQAMIAKLAILRALDEDPFEGGAGDLTDQLVSLNLGMGKTDRAIARSIAVIPVPTPTESKKWPSITEQLADFGMHDSSGILDENGQI
jgi:hypothetical protein